MTTTKTGDDLLIINLKVYAFKVSLTMYVLQQLRMVVMRILTPTINSQLACDGNLNNTQKCKKFNCGDGVVKTITFKSYLLTFKYVLISL